jgi:hypothetical protein
MVIKVKTLVVGILIPLMLFLIPTALLDKYPAICIIKNISGIDCLGCGMTRAISSIFHGNLETAIHYNQLVIIVFPLLVYIWSIFIIRELYALIDNRPTDVNKFFNIKAMLSRRK